VITVEQLFLHTAGFPNAPYAQSEWSDRAKRLERFARWRPEFPPGSRLPSERRLAEIYTLTRRPVQAKAEQQEADRLTKNIGGLR